MMLQEDIPSMLQMIEEKITSSEIEVHHRDALVRLKHILEEDMERIRTGTASERTGDVDHHAARE